MPTVLARRPSDRGGLAIAGAIGTEAAMPYDLRGLVLPRSRRPSDRGGVHMHGGQGLRSYSSVSFVV